jgi:hypothetical protein
MGAAAVFAITKLHEGAVHLADRYFNRGLDALESELGSAMLRANELGEIDRLLASEPFDRLKLTSAASFRRAGQDYVRGPAAEGWDGDSAERLGPEAPLLQPAVTGKPFPVPEGEDGAGLPQGLARPVLGVPAASPLRCYAVSFYGPHASGTDLDSNERGMLARLAARAAAMYAELENGALRTEIERLERALHTARPSVESSGPRPSRRASGPPQGEA